MDELTPNPRVKLSRLRDLGWTFWDPIGLLPTGERWTDEDNGCFADEYDSYLISAEWQLGMGAPHAQVIEYLVRIEIEHMGLGGNLSAKLRAKSLVDAIAAEQTTWTWPDKHGKFD